MVCRILTYLLFKWQAVYKENNKKLEIKTINHLMFVYYINSFMYTETIFYANFLEYAVMLHINAFILKCMYA